MYKLINLRLICLWGKKEINMKETDGTKINWIGAIDSSKLAEIIKAIETGIKENKTKDVTILIDSIGGSVNASLAFYQWIKFNKISLTTVGLSTVASSAVTVLLAGSKRICFENTTFLVHRMTYPFDGEMSEYDLEEKTTFFRTGNTKVKTLYKKETRLSDDEIERLLSKDWIVITAEEAIEKGIVHEIMELE